MVGSGTGVDRGVVPVGVTSAEESAAWVRSLGCTGPEHDEATAALFEILLRGALAEARRRSGTHGLHGPELDDLAHQAAGDAVVSILRRLDDFRGQSRFLTWAYKFVILEVSSKIGRHVWRRDGVRWGPPDGWEELPARFGSGPEEVAESRQVVEALRDGVSQVLTEHQRRVFVALVVHGQPLDAVVVDLDSNRNAVYKTMFDARRKLRAHLVGLGLVAETGSRPSGDGRSSLSGNDEEAR